MSTLLLAYCAVERGRGSKGDMTVLGAARAWPRVPGQRSIRSLEATFRGAGRHRS